MTPLSLYRAAPLWVALALVAAAAPVAAEEPDVLLDALRDELQRNVAQLRLKDLEKPYYIDYALDDLEWIEVHATLGALTQSERARQRPLRVLVRVGSRDLDNSELMNDRSMFAGPSRPAAHLVMDDDYFNIRHDAWLATDDAYKRALEQLADKRALLQKKVEKEKLQDFSVETPVTSLSPRQPLTTDTKKLEELTRRLSSIFRAFPALQASGVSLRLVSANRYFLSSEGTVIREPVKLLSLVARASTQAADGMPLNDFVSFYARSVAALPPEKQLAESIRGMAQELSALARAPLLEKYAGPVLFTDEAACELFAALLVPELNGHRPPVAADERMSAMLRGSDLADRMGRPVLPAFLSIVDDPLLEELDGRPLVGAYRFDHEGVAAQRVSLVEEGKLKALLMSRRPRKEATRSNGHGRRSGFGMAALASNLLVESTGGKTLPELRAALRAAAEEAGLEFGLRIAKVDDGDSGAGDPFALFRSLSRGQSEATLGTPILVYKLFVRDGHEELVRGLTVRDLSVRTLKEVSAVSEERTMTNRLMTGSALSALFARATRGTDGAVGTVVAPAVLLPDLELGQTDEPQQKPALLPHPLFAK